MITDIHSVGATSIKSITRNQHNSQVHINYLYFQHNSQVPNITTITNAVPCISDSTDGEDKDQIAGRLKIRDSKAEGAIKETEEEKKFAKETKKMSWLNSFHTSISKSPFKIWCDAYFWKKLIQNVKLGQLKMWHCNLPNVKLLKYLIKYD